MRESDDSIEKVGFRKGYFSTAVREPDLAFHRKPAFSIHVLDRTRINLITRSISLARESYLRCAHPGGVRVVPDACGPAN